MSASQLINRVHLHPARSGSVGPVGLGLLTIFWSGHDNSFSGILIDAIVDERQHSSNRYSVLEASELCVFMTKKLSPDGTILILARINMAPSYTKQ